MIIEADREDYASLVSGCAPRSFELAKAAIAPIEVLQMLADVAERVRNTFSPASWLIVEENELVGLCSVTRPVEDGVIDIGYGVAPNWQNRGIAGRAIRDVVAWAQESGGVKAITAETSTTNLPSQRVLMRNGFIRVGERLDDEDGLLICWRCAVS